MDFIKRHTSTIVLITIAAFWIGIALGTKECPSCVVLNMAKSTIGMEAGEHTPAADRATAINWSTVDTRGKLLTSEDLEGKVSVLVYWATWCGVCKQEIPDLVALREEYSPTDVAIIGLSFDEAHKDLGAFAAEHGINYQIARVNPSILEAFGEAVALPTLFILDAEGRVQFHHTGLLNQGVLSERVQSLLASGPTSTDKEA